MCSVCVVDVWVLSGQFKRDGVQITRNFDGVGGELSALHVVLYFPKGVKTIVS